MEITEKVAYLKGLAEGMELDTEKKEGKLLSAIIDVLDDIALELEDMKDEQAELADGLEHQIYCTCRQVRRGGILCQIAKVGGSQGGVQSRGGITGDVPDGQIHLIKISLRCQLFDLAEPLHAHQLAAQSAHGCRCRTDAVRCRSAPPTKRRCRCPW